MLYVHESTSISLKKYFNSTLQVSIYSSSDSLNTTFDSKIREAESPAQPCYVRVLRRYTEIPEKSRHIIDIFINLINCIPQEIYIVLLKLRNNYTNVDMSHRFNANEKIICTVFDKRVPSIGEVMKNFIVWPTTFEIKFT